MLAGAGGRLDGCGRVDGRGEIGRGRWMLG